MPTEPSRREARVLRLVRELSAHHSRLFERGVRVSTSRGDIDAETEEFRRYEERIMAVVAAMDRTLKAKKGLLAQLPEADVFRCDGRFWRVQDELVMEVVFLDLGYNAGRRIR